MDQAAVDARKVHRTITPLHGFVYFDPGAAGRYEQLGVTGRGQYFGSRGAALGAVGPGPVVATFFNFCPRLVASCLPAVWDVTTPERMIEARYAAARDVLAPLFGDDVGVVDEANEILGGVVSVIAGMAHGRPLFAGHLDVPEPSDPVGRLWHRLTLLREWRGDAHVAILAAQGTDPCDVLQIHAAAEPGLTPEILRTMRGWTVEEFAVSLRRLVDRGELTPAGELTDQGRANRQAVEDRTDELSAAPWRTLGTAQALRLRQILRPYAVRLVESGPMRRISSVPSD